MAATEDTWQAKLRALPVLQSSYTETDMGNLPSDPQSAFKHWLDEAIAFGVREPHAMVLSTVDSDGYPDARVLILKNIDARGWHFAIKADSPKGRQILHNGKAALTFYWPDMARQVRVRGAANALPEDECRADFDQRPLKARAGAVASKQSEVLTSRDELLQRVSDVETAMAKAADADANGEGATTDEKPKWIVFAVAPKEVEFWQGSKDRLHRRVRYSSQDGGQWCKDLVWP